MRRYKTLVDRYWAPHNSVMAFRLLPFLPFVFIILGTASLSAWGDSSPSLPSKPPMDSQGPVEEVPITQEHTLPGSEYKRLVPHWAAWFSATPSALGGTDLSGGQNVTALGFGLGFEYEPAFLQNIGVIGFGPTLEVDPVVPLNPGVQNNPFTTYSVGGVLRYEAKYFDHQWFVPEAAFNLERFSMRAAAASGVTTLEGPEGGIYLFLNAFSDSQSFEMYKNTGVLRSYLTAEVRRMSGSLQGLSISGTSFYFGMRVEF